MENIKYYQYLLNLLSNMEDNDNFHNELKVSIYLTLMALNNHNYQDKFYQDELNIINNYLRKMNNLKVKIQLKRKDDEIDKIILDLEKIYDNNKYIIDKYNKDNLNIDEIIKSKDSVNITNLIDKLTKEKMLYTRNKDNFDNIRNIINTLEYIEDYKIDNNNIDIKVNDNSGDINITLDDFYLIFDYLLNINYYKNININQKELIKELIDNLRNNEKLNERLLIPIVFNTIINKSIPNYESISTNKFKIDNIKITDLYTFGNNNTSEFNVKCNKIGIPNSYLYDKIKYIVNRGIYYYNEDTFVLENTSDFKISVNKSDVLEFLKDNLLNMINETTCI